jgi:hypothetical protein
MIKKFVLCLGSVACISLSAECMREITSSDGGREQYVRKLTITSDQLQEFKTECEKLREGRDIGNMLLSDVDVLGRSVWYLLFEEMILRIYVDGSPLAGGLRLAATQSYDSFKQAITQDAHEHDLRLALSDWFSTLGSSSFEDPRIQGFLEVMVAAFRISFDKAHGVEEQPAM